jgi:glycosyltransferase involved in cell wall biosynthesis
MHVWDWWQCVDAYSAVHIPMGVPMAVTDMCMNVTRLLPRELPTTFGTPELVDKARAAGRKRVELLVPPVDIHVNAPDTAAGQRFRTQLGVGENDILLVTVSRLVHWMKAESLTRTIEAVRTLGRSLPIKFAIVGDGGARVSLEHLAAEVNAELKREAVVLTGALLDPRPAYAAADVVVGMGGSALRGMAFGKPSLIVGEHGFSIPLTPKTMDSIYYKGIYGRGDGDAGNAGLAGHIRYFAERREDLTSLGVFSREFVVRNFSLEAVSAKLIQLLRRTAEERVPIYLTAADALRTTAVYLRERRFLIRSTYPNVVATVDTTPACPKADIRYAIITPARDEEHHLEATLQAVVAQTIRPERWVIVNDGSKDRTGEIADQYARQYDWIKVLHRHDRGTRKNGAGVVEAFKDGYALLEGCHWDYVVKLDSDLTFGPDYFAQCLREFQRDSKLGIGGGALYLVTPEGKEFEPHPWFHVRGATKVYRRECWNAIGGIWSGPGWDTIDELKANMLGWSTRTFRDIQANHHRRTGGAEGGWRDNVKNGRGNYVVGYHPLYVLIRCLNRAKQKPYVLGSIGMLYGYMSARWKGVRPVDDPLLIRYIRQQQMNRLLGRPTVWK